MAFKDLKLQDFFLVTGVTNGHLQMGSRIYFTATEISAFEMYRI